MGCHFLLQGIFPTQGSNPGLPHCRQTLYRLIHQGSPKLSKSPLSLCSLKALLPVCFLLFHLNKLFFFPHFPIPCLIFLKFILNVFFRGQISQIFSRARQHINQFKKLHNAPEASRVKILRGPDFFSFTLCHSFFLPPPSVIADHSTAVLPQLSVTHHTPPILPSSLPPHSLLL